MTGTLHAYVGLPASGKSTAAKHAVTTSTPGTHIRLNKDDARTQLHAGTWHGHATEHQIIAARNHLIVLFLQQGLHVHVDDTNLAPTHLRTLAGLAFETGADFTVESFLHVDADECVRRDTQRPNPVGEHVIRKMVPLARKLRIPDTKQPVPAPAYNADLPDCVLVDLDGTLSLLGDRDPYDTATVHLDAPNQAVLAHVRALTAAGHTVVAMSGRSDEARDGTASWLRTHLGADVELHMRAAGDRRRDSYVKHDLYHEQVAGRYNVTSVLDDRDQVVRMWRTIGLTCFQVAPGNF